jgi:hypothetical protein
MPESADQPAKHGRSLIGFYIALGVVATLVGLGVWLYRPLRLAYAINRVESTVEYLPIRPGMGIPVADKWLLYVTEAARAGNRRAMGVIIGRAGVKTPPKYGGSSLWPSSEGPDVVVLAASDQPQLFLDVLDHCDAGRVLEVMAVLGEECERSYGMFPVAVAKPMRFSPPAGPADVAARFESVLETARMGSDAERSAALVKLAQPSLTFIRQRFAKEIAEAEQAKNKKERSEL